MKPEDALKLTHPYLHLWQAFDKKLGRLKLVEEMMRKNAEDSTSGAIVMYDPGDWASMLEELQAVISEIEKEMSE